MGEDMMVTSVQYDCCKIKMSLFAYYGVDCGNDPMQRENPIVGKHHRIGDAFGPDRIQGPVRVLDVAPDCRWPIFRGSFHSLLA